MRTVKVEVSGMVPAAIGVVWSWVSYFGDTRAYLLAEDPASAVTANEIGRDSSKHLKRKRVVYIGSGRLHEELVLLDHGSHFLQYKLVSDERNVNPFPASFLDVVSNIRLHRCTMDGGTFIRICSTFQTELEMTGIMQAMWERIYKDVVRSLIRRASKEGQTPRSSFETEQHLDPVRLPSPGAFSQRTVSAPALPQMWAAKRYAPVLPTCSPALPQNPPLGETEDLARCISDCPAASGINALSRSTSYLSLSSCLWMNAEGLRLAQTPNELSRTVSSEYGVGSSARSSLECHEPCGNESVFQVDQSWAGVPVPLLIHGRK